MKKFKNKKMFLLLLIILSLGFISGLIFMFFVSKEDMPLLKEDLNNYISLINNTKFSYKDAFINTLSNNLIYLLIIFISTIIFILFPIVLFLLFYKGFSLGFLFSNLLIIYKLKGLYYFIIFIFPCVLINIFLYLLISQISIKAAKNTINLIYKNEMISIRGYYKKYLLNFLIFIGLFIISTFIEIFLGTFLIKTFI